MDKDRVLHVVKHHQERIEHHYQQAIDGGRESPVIIVLDLADKRARLLAVAMKGKELVAERIAACNQKKMTPLLLLDVDLEAACTLLLKEGFPDVQTRGHVAAGKLPAVVIAGDTIVAVGGIIP